MIAVRNSLIFQVIQNDSELEILWCRVKSQFSSVIIGACYRPPNSPSSFVDLINESIDYTASRYNNCAMIFAADFNYPGIDRSNFSTLPSCHYSSNCRCFIRAA